MESLKMLALVWCKKGTDEDGPTNRSDCLKYALRLKGNLRIFGATYIQVQCVHQRKEYKEGKVKLWKA